MPVGEVRRHPSPSRPGQETDLDQVRLVDVLDRLWFFRERGRQRVEPDGPALELDDHGLQQPAVQRLEADLVDLQHGKRVPGDVDGRPAVAAHLGVVAHAPQEAVRDARRAASSAGDLGHGVDVDLDVEDPCRAADDLLELRLGVEVEAVNGAEAVAERAAEQTLARRGPDASEMRQRQRGRAGPHSLPQHRVETKLLERGVQRLFDHGVEAMDLVDEEDIARAQVQEDGSKRPLVVDRRAGADLDGDAELVGDDVGERRLAQAGRSAQKHVLHRLVPAARGLEQDAQVVAHLFLADVLAEESGTEREVVLVVVGARVEDLVLGHWRPSAFSAVARASCVPGEDFQSTASMPERASCEEKPRLRSAASTAFGTAPSPAAAAARGTASRAATASSRGLISMITLAAVRGPTPLARLIGAASSLMLARFKTSRLAALRMLSPTFGPTPSTWISISNSSSSSTVANS